MTAPMRFSGSLHLLCLALVAAAGGLIHPPSALAAPGGFDIVIDSSNSTISGDGDGNDLRFKGVPFFCRMEASVLRFYIRGDVTVGTSDTVTARGALPVALHVGGNAVFEAGAVVNASADGQTPGPGGGWGGGGGAGGWGGWCYATYGSHGGYGAPGGTSGNVVGYDGISGYAFGDGPSGLAGEDGTMGTSGTAGVNSPGSGGAASTQTACGLPGKAGGAKGEGGWGGRGGVFLVFAGTNGGDGGNGTPGSNGESYVAGAYTPAHGVSGMPGINSGFNEAISSGGGGAGGNGGGGGGAGGGGGGAGSGGGGGGGGWGWGDGGQGGDGGDGGMGGHGGSGGHGGKGGDGGAGGGGLEIYACGRLTITARLMAQGGDPATGEAGDELWPAELGGASHTGRPGSPGQGAGGAGGNGGAGAKGGDGGTGALGGNGADGRGGAGGTIMLKATTIASSGAQVDVSGVSGGENGRFLFGASATLSFDGASSGATATTVTGSRIINPFLSGAIPTPFIPALQDGPEVFGLLDGYTATSPTFASVVAGAPSWAKAALLRRAIGPAGYDDSYRGFSMVFFINLSPGDLSSPTLGIGSSAHSQPLLMGGFTRRDEFGGLGLSDLAVLPAGAVYATLIPDGVSYFSAGYMDGAESTSRTETDLIADEPIYLPAPTFTLTYAASAGGFIAGETSQTVNHRMDGSLVIAVPDPGNHFVQWSDGATSNPRQDVNVTTDISVTAIFASGLYTLTYEAGPHGTITGATSQSVAHGDSGTSVTAVPDEGYHFVQWSDGSISNPRTDFAVMTDIAVTATFAINYYTLIYYAGPFGLVNGATSVTQVVAHGSTAAAVTAVADEGWHFVQWTDGATTNPRVDAGVTSDMAMAAVFDINLYTLIYLANASGVIMGPTTQTVPHGYDGVPVFAVPDTNFRFDRWSDGSTSNPRTDTHVTSDITVTADFSFGQYRLHYAAGPGGSVSGELGQLVSHGANGTPVTTIPDEGYHFVGWSDGRTDNPRQDLNIMTDLYATALFEINQYCLIYFAGTNGTVNGATSVTQWLAHGSTGPVVTAIPDEGYHFVQWTDGLTSNPRQDMNVTTEQTVLAIFDINLYTLFYAAGPGGSIDYATMTTQTIPHGTDGTTVTAIPDTGFHFIGWSDGATTNPRQDIHPTTSIAVTALFEINQYTLTYYAGPNGTVNFATSFTQTVFHGGVGAIVKAMPDEGCYFIRWSDGFPDANRQDTNVTTDLIVMAGFDIYRYTLTYGAEPNGRLAGPTTQSVAYGSDGEAVAAVPDPDYHFIRWSDGATSNPRVDKNVKADLSTTASFAIGFYSLLYFAGAGGTLDGVTSQAVPHGASGTLVTAVPNPGYHFLQWSDGLTSISRTDENVMTDVSVTALFLTHDVLLDGIKRYLLGLGPAVIGYDRNRDGLIDAADLLWAIQEPR